MRLSQTSPVVPGWAGCSCSCSQYELPIVPTTLVFWVFLTPIPERQSLQCRKHSFSSRSKNQKQSLVCPIFCPKTVCTTFCKFVSLFSLWWFYFFQFPKLCDSHSLFAIFDSSSFSAYLPFSWKAQATQTTLIRGRAPVPSHPGIK